MRLIRLCVAVLLATTASGVARAQPSQRASVAIEQIPTAPDRPRATTIEQIGLVAIQPRLVPASYQPDTSAPVPLALEFADLPVGYMAALAAPVDAAGNVSVVALTGSDNGVTIEQSGLLNTSLVLQMGSRNAAVVIQSSDGNYSMISQSGIGDFASVRQGG